MARHALHGKCIFLPSCSLLRNVDKSLKGFQTIRRDDLSLSLSLLYTYMYAYIDRKTIESINDRIMPNECVGPDSNERIDRRSFILNEGMFLPVEHICSHMIQVEGRCSNSFLLFADVSHA